MRYTTASSCSNTTTSTHYYILKDEIHLKPDPKEEINEEKNTGIEYLFDEKDLVL